MPESVSYFRSIFSGKAASGRDSLDNDTETGSIVSQRRDRDRERPRRKHTNDHGQKALLPVVFYIGHSLLNLQNLIPFICV